MFLFDAIDRTRFDDYRASVHDLDGLAMLTGRGEWLWRPLSNPQTLQISAFVDHGPRGFGLMQRKREFSDYRDLEARYERRPAVWVEPVGDWGAGHVELVEILSGSEVNDNIVTYWRPRDPLGAGREVRLTYRLYWGDGWPLQGPAPLARAQSSMSGGAHHRDGERRLFVIEFTGGNLDGDIKAEVSTGQGQVSNIVSRSPTLKPEAFACISNWIRRVRHSPNCGHGWSRGASRCPRHGFTDGPRDAEGLSRRGTGRVAGCGLHAP